MKKHTALAAISLAGATVVAGNPWPAVELSPHVPDSVRDQTARSLAEARDTLGWTIHPFRGEFHGLGSPEGGWSRANDLSANGRVVVGADYDGSGGSEAFVWAPWTERAVYDMRPAGFVGDTEASAVSADGTYILGNVRTLDSTATEIQRGSLWSLTGRTPIGLDGRPGTKAVDLSGDGNVVVGTLVTQPNASSDNPAPPHHGGSDVGGADPSFNSDLDDEPTVNVPSRWSAYRQRKTGEVEQLSTVAGYSDVDAVGVSADGETVLVNGLGAPSFYGHRYGEPFLWRGDGSVQALGRPTLDGSDSSPATWATAISADGGAVVGTASYGGGFVYSLSGAVGEYRLWPRPTHSGRAALWRESDGWRDLGDLTSTADRQFLYSHATSVSSAGERVLGNALVGQLGPYVYRVFGFIEYTSIDQVPFLWDEARGMRELRDVLALDYGLDLAGWDLGEATKISDDGTTVIGNGTNPAGDPEAWRAVLQRNTPHGDLDFDGDVDQFDYVTLAANLGATADDGAIFYADGDLNADGRIDRLDADALMAVYDHRWAGDFNADGVVDLSDYTFWRDLAGQLTVGLADANGDGLVGAADLAAWRQNFGMTIGAIVGRTVPEPGAIVLVTLLALTVWRDFQGGRSSC